MIKIIRGKYGQKLSPAGTILSLSDAEEQRLVKRGVAVFVSENESKAQYQDSFTPVLHETESSEENVEAEDKIDIWPEEKIRKLSSKKKIVEYAQSIGLLDLDETMSKDDLIDEVLNYIGENYES
nr:MAG TPA: hypothetical protein [Caudoviricetes sp.]